MVIFITLLPTDNSSNRRFRCRRAHKTFPWEDPGSSLSLCPPSTGNISNRRFLRRKAHTRTSLGGARVILVTVPPPQGISQTDDSDAERLTKTPPGETQANLYNSSPPTGNFSNLRFRCIRAHKDTSLGGPTLILITLPPPHQEYRKPTIPLQRDSQKPLGRPRVILITLPPPGQEYLKPTIPLQKGSQKHLPGKTQGNPYHFAPPPHREYLKPTILQQQKT